MFPFPRMPQSVLQRAAIYLSAGIALPCVAASPSPSYNRDVRPILSANCFACHGADAAHRQGGLRLDTEEGARSKTESGAVAISPGAPGASAVWKRITSTDPDEVMPPPESHKTLTAKQKGTLRRWIEVGAKYEPHWAFTPPRRDPLPAGAGNPVDFFIHKKLRGAGLEPAPEADRAILLRRLSLDLTGLPPSLEELDAFLADRAPGAYGRQVDRLLSSPRFGEHMASAWLDLSRYSDSNGYLHDVMRTGWPWRDWVIDAFNKDMPFDQFAVEQIAGDLLPGATETQVLATAFMRNHPITDEGGTIGAEYLNEYASDRVETVGTVFMGLTFNCCRCHDHKFDPLPQSDFYSLLAYFNSITERHHENDGSPAYPPLIEVASPLAPDKGKAKVMIMQEAAKPKPTFVLSRGAYDQPDKERPVTRRPPELFGAPPEGEPANRLGLARWIVSERNPLIARVAVNRLWQGIFGTGLSNTVDDFGLQGEYPSHPELLDYLAVEFRDGPASGGGRAWSTKHILRLIVTSETYRQSSDVRTELAAADPDNRLLGYFPRRRLSAEQMRDTALFISGLLEEQMGGPPVKPYQPEGLWKEKANQPNSPTGHYVRGKGSDLYRRSIYTFHKRTSPPPLMTIFDAPDRTGCSARRYHTNTPLGVLVTINSEQFLECARVLATRTLKGGGTTDERLTQLFRRTTSRNPSAKDLKTLRDGLETLKGRYSATPDDAAKLLEQGDAPIPEGVDRAELAAWTIVASTVLNLDEALVRN